MYEICIVGAGATGLCLLLLLQEAAVFDLKKVVLVDPHFDGGDLARSWGPVLSNTPWSKTLDAIKAAAPSLRLAAAPPDPTASCPLFELAAFLREAAAGAFRSVEKVQGEATQVSWSAATAWDVQVYREGGLKTLKAKRLVLATGSVPRGLDLPIPSLALSMALNPHAARQMVKPGDHVVVFGTAHSGTLVVRNLIEGCEATVTNFYKGPQPFFWDRDGAYDGIKREAADIADKAMRGDYGAALELHSVEDVSSVVRATQKAAWVVYATGFEPRRGISFLVEGLAKNGATYDGATGKLTEVPAAWGFGIAYPNRAPDGIHWDVSVAAFLEHMKRALPDLCK